MADTPIDERRFTEQEVGGGGVGWREWVSDLVRKKVIPCNRSMRDIAWACRRTDWASDGAHR